MGKLAKPQRSKKHKKIKAVDPFYQGSRKDRLHEGQNQKPKSILQEVPKKLQKLGFMIDDVKSGKTGKKSRNKFLNTQDAPVKYNRVFPTVMGDSKDVTAKSQKLLLKKRFARKIKDDPTLKPVNKDEPKPEKGKRKKPKLKAEDVEEYIDNLKPVKPFVDNVKFTKKKGESDGAFMMRVNKETNAVVAKAKVDDQYDVSDERKIAMMVKAKKSKMNEKKKQRLTDKKKKKLDAVKEKKNEKLLDFGVLQDKVEFGDVVHAPPVLSTRPKKAAPVDHDRPGLRMPELKEAINRNLQEASSMKGQEPRPVGQTRKRKLMTFNQRRMEDSRREEFVEAYREMKRKKAKLKPT